MKLSFEEKKKQANRKTVAQYLSLYTENNHLKKSMVTLTPPDGKLLTLLNMREKFFIKLGKTKLLKKTGDKSIKYFSSIEWTKHSQPHLHIQFFYTNFIPIKKAFDYIVNKDNILSNHILHGNSSKVKYNYVIKEYFISNFDIDREHYKADTIARYKYQGVTVKFKTSSRKKINNKITTYLLRTLTFKTKDKYKEILTLLNNGKIQINKGVEYPNLNNNTVKSWVNIGLYEVIIFY